MDNALGGDAVHLCIDICWMQRSPEGMQCSAINIKSLYVSASFETECHFSRFVALANALTAFRRADVFGACAQSTTGRRLLQIKLRLKRSTRTPQMTKTVIILLLVSLVKW